MILDALSLDFFDTINAQWAIEINRVYTPPPLLTRRHPQPIHYLPWLSGTPSPRLLIIY